MIVLFIFFLLVMGIEREPRQNPKGIMNFEIPVFNDKEST